MKNEIITIPSYEDYKFKNRKTRWKHIFKRAKKQGLKLKRRDRLFFLNGGMFGFSKPTFIGSIPTRTDIPMNILKEQIC